MPRVGDRPAGADRGDGLTTPVLTLAAGDLGCSKLRARGVAGLGGLTMLPVDDDLVMSTVVGLIKSAKPEELSAALDRFENRVGSTFSESSVSTASAALRLPAVGDRARTQFSHDSISKEEKIRQNWPWTRCDPVASP